MATATTPRFWQPAPEASTQLLCAYLDAGEAPAHLHEEWQFGVMEAPSKLSLGAFRRFSAQPDDVTVVAPYEVHTEGSQPGTDPQWRMLYVASSMIGRLHRDAAPRFRGPVVTDPLAAAALRDLLQQSADGTTTGPEFLSRAARWLEQFLPRHADRSALPQRGAAVERARTYLQGRPTEAVTLPQVGMVAGVTISHLVRSFSKSVGLPPRSYHAQVRLARARRLLAEGKSATWVAYECGFSDQSHLSRRFKECHGITPGAFQAQYLSEPVVEANAA
jgi:AraC-like DNA-binding protein